MIDRENLAELALTDRIPKQQGLKLKSNLPKHKASPLTDRIPKQQGLKLQAHNWSMSGSSLTDRIPKQQGLKHYRFVQT